MLEIKRCPQCELNKSASDFHKDITTISGLQSRCKACKKENRLEYRERNREKIRESKRRYYHAHVEQERAAARKNQAKSRDKRRLYLYNYVKNRLKSDVQFKLRETLRNRLRSALKDNTKTGSAVRDLGCSIEHLKKYLESKFQPGMSWENWGKWHIDHIRPLASFDLTDTAQFKQAVHFTNLQPLWALENISKGSKYEHSKVS